MLLKIALIRCGMTQLEREDKLVGITDAPLSDEGIAQIQMRAAQKRYPAVSRIYTSSLLRCRQTAELIYPGQQAEVIKGIEAMNCGIFEGKNRREIEEDGRFDEWANGVAADSYPEGESPHGFHARCLAAFRLIVEEMSSDGVEAAAVITHKMVIDTIMQHHCIPKSHYHYLWVPNGGGVATDYDTRRNIFKINFLIS